MKKTVPEILSELDAIRAQEQAAGHRARRERIATAALAGLLRADSTYEGAAYDAVMHADALIAELDKEAP